MQKTLSYFSTPRYTRRLSFCWRPPTSFRFHSSLLAIVITLAVEFRLTCMMFASPLEITYTWCIELVLTLRDFLKKGSPMHSPKMCKFGKYWYYMLTGFWHTCKGWKAFQISAYELWRIVVTTAHIHHSSTGDLKNNYTATECQISPALLSLLPRFISNAWATLDLA